MLNLGSIMSLEYGEALPADRRTGSGYPVYGSNGVVGFHDTALVDGPGVIVGRKGSVGQVSWSDSNFWPIDTTYYVSSNGDILGWIYRVLDWLPLNQLDTSTGVPGLNRNDVYRIEVFKPLRPEQKKIAEILDTLDTQIRRTEALIAKLEHIKQGLLTDLLTRGIDENGQLRPSPEEAPDLYKDSPLGWIPREWQVKPFLEVASLPSGQVSPLAPEYSEMPLVAPDHIESGTAKLIKLESVREQGAISGKYLFQAGDIIYSKIRPYLNKMWLADRDGLCSADMYPLRPLPGVSSVFLLLVVMGERFSKFANSVSMRTGIPKINRDELSSYQLAVPTTAEQSMIEEALSSINQRLSMERQTLTKLMYEKLGLLDDLLTGSVRVTPLLETAKEAYG